MKRTIQDLVEKIKGVALWFRFDRYALPTLSDDVFLGVVIILVAFGSFGLGRLSRIEGAREPIRIENMPSSPTVDLQEATVSRSVSAMPPKEAGSQLVGSKNGKKYYYVWCSGANRISESNRIYFTSQADAEARGYTPSSMCKGL